MSTFVTVGNRNESFHRLLSSVSQISSLLPQPVIVQYGHTQFSDPNCKCIDFLDGDTFVSHIQAATLIISHGGAGSILTCFLQSKRPLIVPRLSSNDEIVDDQQLELCRHLVERGKIHLCEDGDLAAFFSYSRPEQFECQNPPFPQVSDALPALQSFSDLFSSLIKL